MLAPAEQWVVRCRLALVLLLLIATISALAVVVESYESRRLFVGLQQLEQQERDLRVQIGQLLLEEGMYSAPAMIEKTARRELSMSTPQSTNTALLFTSSVFVVGGGSGK